MAVISTYVPLDVPYDQKQQQLANNNWKKVVGEPKQIGANFGVKAFEDDLSYAYGKVFAVNYTGDLSTSTCTCWDYLTFTSIYKGGVVCKHIYCAANWVKDRHTIPPVLKPVKVTSIDFLQWGWFG